MNLKILINRKLKATENTKDIKYLTFKVINEVVRKGSGLVESMMFPEPVLFIKGLVEIEYDNETKHFHNISLSYPRLEGILQANGIKYK